MYTCSSYIPEDVKIEEEFEQLVSGVIWLVRDGRNFVSASQAMESSSIQETGRYKLLYTIPIDCTDEHVAQKFISGTLDYFVNVNSGRLAIGHDKAGRIVIVHVDGHTAERGSVYMLHISNLFIEERIMVAVLLQGKST